MAKRRRAKSASVAPKAEWPNHVVIDLLSWLDFTIQHSDIDLEKTVVAHLKQKCQRDYTFRQIKRKLKDLWHSFGRDNSHSFNDLLDQGHFCLDYLDDDVKHDIELGSQALESEHRHNQPTSKRSTRGGSKLKTYGRTSLQASPRQSTRTETPQNQATTYRQNSGTPIKSERRKVSCTPETIQHATKRRKFNRNSVTSSSLPSTSFPYSPTIEDSQDENTHISSENHRNPTSSPFPIRRKRRSGINKTVHTAENDPTQEKTRCICGITDGTINWVRCKKCGVWQHCICVGVDLTEAETMDYLCEECNPEAHHAKREGIKPSWRSKDVYPQVDNGVQIDDVLLDLAKEEISSLRAKLRDKTIELQDCEQERSDFEQESRLLRSNQKQIEKNSPEYLVEQRDKEILRLRKELEERKKLSRFTKLDSTSHEVFNEDTIETIGDIFGSVEQLPCRNGPVVVPLQLDQYNTLEKIIYEVFGHGDSSPQITEDLRDNLAAMTTLEILRALTACCLRIWVFESDFPRLEGSSSKYLASLRETLIKSDGVVAVRNLDLATHNAIIVDEDFTSTYLDPEAEHLTIQYSKVIEPLFSQNPSKNVRQSWDGFSTWNEDKEMWQDRQSQLLNIFRTATWSFPEPSSCKDGSFATNEE
ncbi:hypothetical protein NHQ30_004353 [Ciborinia camelliae]|nr:hypothetical protein NHQ30_004353 [Ciborinia camelliae]